MQGNKNKVYFYLKKFFIFACLANVSYITWMLGGNPFDYKLDNLIIWRSAVTINAFIYVTLQFYIFKRYLVDKVQLRSLISLTLIVNLVFFVLHILITYPDGVEKVMALFQNRVNRTELYIFYFVVYYNFFGAFIYMPDLIGSFIIRNDKLQYSIQKNVTIEFQNRLFSKLYIDSLENIKNITNTEEREKKLIALSDFYRFVVYESENDCVPISKAVKFGNLYLKIVSSTYPNVVIKGELKPPYQYFNTPTMYVLNGLQNVIDLVRELEHKVEVQILPRIQDEEFYYYGMKIGCTQNEFTYITEKLKKSKTISDVIDSIDEDKQVLHFKSKKANSVTPQPIEDV